MEDVLNVMKALREAEYRRLLSLAYALWVPLGGFVTYLMLLTKSYWPLWLMLIGLIPYITLFRKAKRVRVAELSNKNVIVRSVILAIILDFAFGIIDPPLGSAGSVAGWLTGIALSLGKEGVWDLVAGWGTVALTLVAYLVGMSIFEQWVMFMLALIACYSLAAVARALEALYEVLPYVGESEQR